MATPYTFRYGKESVTGSLLPERYHQERRQPGDKIARSIKELERLQRRLLIPVTLKALQSDITRSGVSPVIKLLVQSKS